MPFADDDPPFAAADLDLRPVADAVIGRRHRWDAAAIAGMAQREDVAVRRVEPGESSKGAGGLRVIGGPIAGHHARVQPFLLADPERRVPALGEPAREPD